VTSITAVYRTFDRWKMLLKAEGSVYLVII